MEDFLRNGEEVLIFSNRSKYISLVDFSYVEGVVVTSKDEEVVPPHGKTWNVRVYTVVGVDGTYYKATRTGIFGTRVMTNEEYANHLEGVTRLNNLKINKLQKENEKIRKKIKQL